MLGTERLKKTRFFRSGGIGMRTRSGNARHIPYPFPLYGTAERTSVFPAQRFNLKHNRRQPGIGAARNEYLRGLPFAAGERKRYLPPGFVRKP